MTSGEKYEKAKERVAERLATDTVAFAVLPNGKENPSYKHANVNESKPTGGVMGRLGKIAKGEREPLDTITSDKKKESLGLKNEKDAKKKEKKKEPMGLDKIAEKDKDLNKKKKELDKDTAKNKPDGKDTKGKDAEKEKDGKKLSPEQKEAVQNQEKKMKEAFAKVKLPSGMEVHQEGPKWVLVGKNGVRTDITDCMNAVDDFNKAVDAENAAQKGVESSKNIIQEANSTTQKIRGSDSEVDKQSVVSQWLQKEVKLPNGQPAINPEDTKALAETALKYSDEKELLSKLKNPKDLENEANEKDKQNKEKNDYLKQMYGKTNTGR